MNVNKSILIDAAPEKIFPIINDLSNWEQWSPWVIAEPTALINVAKDGKYHDWDGDIIEFIQSLDLVYSQNKNLRGQTAIPNSN